MDGTSNPEQGNAIEQERIKAFIQELVKIGRVELVFPLNLQDKQFFLRFREIPHKMSPSGLSVSPENVFEANRWNGVTSHQMIDLFEKNRGEEDSGALPIGHIDFNVARFKDIAIANGNKSARDVCIQDMDKENTLSQKTDPLWVNGIDVLDNRRGMGFGRLLSAVGLSVLKESGVGELDFHGALSEKYQPILKELGYVPGSMRQPISSFNQEAISLNIRPFVG